MSTAVAGDFRSARAGVVPPFADDESTRAFAGRTWSAYAALGGGLVLVALGAEHLGEHLALGAAALTVGSADLVWSVAALRGPAPLPRAALATLLGGAVGWLVTAVGVVGAVGAADVAAVGLQLGAAVLLATTRRAPSARRPARPVLRLGILALGSLVSAAITVPGLASTDAGAAAPGMPGMPGMGSVHHGHG